MTHFPPLLRCAAACLFVALVALWALFVAGCTTVHIDPPLHFARTPLLAWGAAEDVANETDGDVYYVNDTHSMEPVLWGGDYIVVVPTPFENYLVGQVMTYQAQWAPAPRPPVTHRIVQKTSTGFIMAGDNVSRSEASWRVTDTNDIGLDVGIWRVRK